MVTRKETAKAQLRVLAEKSAQDSTELNILLKEIEYLQCEESLAEYVKHSWKYFDPFPFSDNWHIDAIADHVQACLVGDIKDLVVSVPPRLGKSSIISVAAPTWAWGPAKMPHLKFLTFSYGSSGSTRDAVKSRRLIGSAWYQEAWGDRFSLLSDVNQKTRYENTEFGYRIASSVGGIGTGEGYDVMFVDDPLKAGDSASTAELENVIEWWEGTLSTRANDPRTARRIVIMQRLAQNDLTGHILERNPDFVHLKLPMEYVQTSWISPVKGWFDPRSFAGELIDYNRFDNVAVEKLKKMGAYKYSAQYQQEPAPREGGIIKNSYFRYYHAYYQEYDIIIQSWDMAIRDTAAADYSVGQVWGKKGGNIYLLDQVREKMGIVEQIRHIVRLKDKFPTTRAILIEAAATGVPVMEMLKNKISGIIAIPPKEYGKGKEERLNACIPEFESGNVFFPHPTIAPWVNTIVEELLLFPKANHDDTVDACAQALNWLAHKGSAVSFDFAITRENYAHTAENARSIYQEHQSRPALKEIRSIFD